MSPAKKCSIKLLSKTLKTLFFFWPQMLFDSYIFYLIAFFDQS